MSEGVFLGCKHAIPLMTKRDGGSIINMSPTGALLGYPVYLAYSAAKGAVRSMTKSVAVVCQDKGCKIRCNWAKPGASVPTLVAHAEGRPGERKALPGGGPAQSG